MPVGFVCCPHNKGKASVKGSYWPIHVLPTDDLLGVTTATQKSSALMRSASFGDFYAMACCPDFIKSDGRGVLSCKIISTLATESYDLSF
jgi:hypothetical protein